MRNDICLLFVTFNPSSNDINYINEKGKEYKCIVIDNTESNNNIFSSKIITIINKNENGIAGAQNIGIKYIVDKLYYIKYVIFFDQDSRVDKEYPIRIVTEYERIAKTRSNLALLGPTVVHIDSNEEYKSVIHKDKEDKNGFVEKREIISSGACTPIKFIKAIGGMDNTLFIDFVDFEWCWRAEKKDYQCGITKNVIIHHQVGNKELKFPGGYRVILSSPFRYFYQYRNYLLLSRRCYVPKLWKISNGIKYMARLLYFPFLGKFGRTAWKFMIKGIIKGLKHHPNNIICFTKMT